MTTAVVATYVAQNHIQAADIPGLIASVHAAVAGLGQAPYPETLAETAKPAVPIKRSITDDFILSLEDGRKFKSLKRHLAAGYGMTSADYRAKWGLPADYPMVAPALARARSELAKGMGLGSMRSKR